MECSFENVKKFVLPRGCDFYNNHIQHKKLTVLDEHSTSSNGSRKNIKGLTKEDEKSSVQIDFYLKY